MSAALSVRYNSIFKIFWTRNLDVSCILKTFKAHLSEKKSHEVIKLIKNHLKR